VSALAVLARYLREAGRLRPRRGPGPEPSPSPSQHKLARMREKLLPLPLASPPTRGGQLGGGDEATVDRWWASVQCAACQRTETGSLHGNLRFGGQLRAGWKHLRSREPQPGVSEEPEHSLQRQMLCPDCVPRVEKRIESLIQIKFRGRQKRPATPSAVAEKDRSPAAAHDAGPADPKKARLDRQDARPGTLTGAAVVAGAETAVRDDPPLAEWAASLLVEQSEAADPSAILARHEVSIVSYLRQAPRTLCVQHNRCRKDQSECITLRPYANYTVSTHLGTNGHSHPVGCSQTQAFGS
jgi:hypothetical protein